MHIFFSIVVGYFKYCRASTGCPSCYRQIYLNLFSTSQCLADIGILQIDCKERHFTHAFTAPGTAGTYVIKVLIYEPMKSKG